MWFGYIAPISWGEEGYFTRSNDLYLPPFTALIGRTGGVGTLCLARGVCTQKDTFFRGRFLSWFRIRIWIRIGSSKNDPQK